MVSRHSVTQAASHSQSSSSSCLFVLESRYEPPCWLMVPSPHSRKVSGQFSYCPDPVGFFSAWRLPQDSLRHIAGEFGSHPFLPSCLGFPATAQDSKLAPLSQHVVLVIANPPNTLRGLCLRLTASLSPSFPLFQELSSSSLVGFTTVEASAWAISSSENSSLQLLSLLFSP